ncbi:MAG: NfeD family protein [Muribaculaceae bacterium]
MEPWYTEPWIIWLIACGILLITEVLTQMLWALCLAVGCLLGFAGDLCGASPLWQFVLFIVGALLSYVLLVPLFQRWHALQVDRKGKAARTGMDALLDRRAVLADEITAERPGRGRIDGDNWQMVSDDKAVPAIPRGTEVVVTGYDSIILRVKPVTTEN